jgi:PAS domain S-box-containing protein
LNTDRGDRDEGAFAEPRASDGTPHETASLHALLVNSVRDYAIFALDRAGRVLTWNAGAAAIKGYTAAEIIGKHFSIFYTAEDIASRKPEWELEEAQRMGRVEDEAWRLRKDGSLFWANVIITALFEKGELVGFAKVTRDLTERRAAEERARDDARRIAEVEAAIRAKAEFLTAMSHELRTPLNAIAGYTDLLLLGVHGNLNEEQRRDAERIRLSQRHLLGIINDLLNFTRVEAGRVHYRIEVFEVMDVIEDVTPMVLPQTIAKGIAMTVVPPAAPMFALADRSKAEQVLLNLLSNAVKFTDPGGSITVHTAESGTRVEIAVADTGIGISAEEVGAIFEPFVQVGRSLTTAHEGTGLGLAISRDLARAMDGDITVASEPGVGSCFTFSLPAGNPAAEPVR